MKNYTDQELDFINNIHNIDLYSRAFVHRSYIIPHNDIKLIEKPYHCVELKSNSNERLEFLGDGILECITKIYLYKILFISILYK